MRPEDADQRLISGRRLIVFIFALSLASGAWTGTVGRFPLIGLCLVAVGALTYVWEFALPLPNEPRPALRPSDWLAAVVVSAPLFADLVLTWSQEFPYGGDQVYHNGASLEAYAFWWWLPWSLAVLSIILAVRFPSLALPMLIALMFVGIAGQPLAFAGRYPGTLHFLAVPLHALPFRSPLNVERLLNVLSVPVWLLVLRPVILRRRIDLGSLAAAVFLFWQKDVVYYFTSGYLEPWAVVLLLTAGEHLVRFGSQMIWRPMLLLGAAAMVKDQAVLSLPAVALVYFPLRSSWRERFRYVLIVACAVAPVGLFVFARRSFRTWQPAYPDMSAFSAAHFAAFGWRIGIEFGASLPLILIAFAILVVLAACRRAFAALLLASVVSWLVFFTAAVLQEYPGYPRGNLVLLAYAALAFGSGVEWLAGKRRTAAWAAVTATAILNGVVLGPFLRDTLRPDSARNFVEHSDAPIYYPIRQAIERAAAAGLVSPGRTIALLNDGKWTHPIFYPGPIPEQYPDLSRRYRILVKSFAFDGNPQRCRCADGETTIALFIRFENLGVLAPDRRAMESEAQQCSAEMMVTCRRTMPITQEGALVALAGTK